jgi:hypothetical protein
VYAKNQSYSERNFNNKENKMNQNYYRIDLESKTIYLSGNGMNQPITDEEFKSICEKKGTNLRATTAVQRFIKFNFNWKELIGSYK